MVKNIAKIIVALALLGALAYALWLLFPSEETKIRQDLQKLAELATFTGREGNFKRVATASALADHFATNAEIAVELPGRGVHTLQGRAEIRQTAFGAMAQGRRIKVEFYDTNVALAPDKLTAKVELTAKIFPGEGDFILQELHFQMRKVDSGWVIEQIETVQTFR